MTIPAMTIDRLDPRRLPQAHALSRAVGWPHRQEDWAFVLRLGRGFAVLAGGEVLGTAIWWPFGERYARVGMVIVAPAAQGRGVGRRLMEAALAEAGARTVLLNATAEGLPLYGKLGFRPIGSVRQHQGAKAVPAGGPLPAGYRLRPLEASDRDAAMALDGLAVGFARPELFDALSEAGQGLALERGGALAGFAMIRRFGRGFVIGPVVAPEPHPVKALIGACLAAHPAAFLRVDAPASSGLSPWLEARGLPQVGEVVTMVRGAAPPEPAAARLFALANQALG